MVEFNTSCEKIECVRITKSINRNNTRVCVNVKLEITSKNCFRKTTSEEALCTLNF